MTASERSVSLAWPPAARLLSVQLANVSTLFPSTMASGPFAPYSHRRGLFPMIDDFELGQEPGLSLREIDLPKKPNQSVKPAKRK